MTRLEKLIDCGLRAIHNNRHLLVRTKEPNLLGLEITINQTADIMYKLTYYKSLYTEDLKLKTDNEFEIIDFMEYDIETNQIYYNEGDVNEDYIVGEENNEK